MEISSRFSRGMSTPEIRAICLPLLALPLLVARVIADHPHNAAASDDLALFADRLHARPNLHLNRRPYLLVPIGDPTPVEVVRSDLHQHLVSVLQLDAEHGIGQWLDHRAFEHDGIFLGLGQVALSCLLFSSASQTAQVARSRDVSESGVALGQSVPTGTDQAQRTSKAVYRIQGGIPAAVCESPGPA